MTTNEDMDLIYCPAGSHELSGLTCDECGEQITADDDTVEAPATEQTPMRVYHERCTE